MKIETTELVPSRLYPEVIYTIRRLTERERTQVQMELSDSLTASLIRMEEMVDLEDVIVSAREPYRERIEQLEALEVRDPEDERELGDLLRHANEDATKVLSAEQSARLYRLRIEESSEEMNTVVPAWIRAGLLRVEGIEVDGESVGIDGFLTNAPDDALREACALIQERAQLSEEERKNSASPSTSNGAADGEKTVTSAPSVSGRDSTETVTADASSPKTSAPN